VQPGTTREEKKTGWRIYRPYFKQKDCIGCRNCELMCPDGAVYRIDKKKYDADMDACKGCGICAEMCPVDDIDMFVEGEKAERGPAGRTATDRPDENYGGPIESAERRGSAPDKKPRPGGEG